MATEVDPIIIKKYANRRLYNTGSSSYVTLEDLAEMVKAGEDFKVQDAKSGDEITRSVLTQIIFEQEGKEGQNLLPVSFLRQLIRYYGDSMQTMVPSYLEHSMNSFAREQDKMREQMTKAFGGVSVPGMPNMEEQVRQNMEMFQNAMSMFMPFGGAPQSDAPADENDASQQAESSATSDAGPSNGDDDLEAMKKQIAEMQRKLNDLS